MRNVIFPKSKGAAHGGSFWLANDREGLPGVMAHSV